MQCRDVRVSIWMNKQKSKKNKQTKKERSVCSAISQCIEENKRERQKNKYENLKLNNMFLN